MRWPAVKRLIPLGLLLPALAGALEYDLGAPSFDGTAETTYRQVTWSDFKGGGQPPPGWSRWSAGTFAHIATGLRPGSYEVDTRQETDAWVAAVKGIRPYAVMDKFHSAVRPGSRKPAVLAHEQLHFDLAETVARRLAVELAGLEGHGGTALEARADLERRLRAGFEKGLRELAELQASYDGETHNGQDRKKQKKWAARIDEMFREATDALVELLEK